MRWDWSVVGTEPCCDDERRRWRCAEGKTAFWWLEDVDNCSLERTTKTSINKIEIKAETPSHSRTNSFQKTSFQFETFWSSNEENFVNDTYQLSNRMQENENCPRNKSPLRRPFALFLGIFSSDRPILLPLYYLFIHFQGRKNMSWILE